MVKLKEFLVKDIHPDFTEKDEEIYYLKKEVDEKIASTILDKYIEFAVDFDRVLGMFMFVYVSASV